MLNVRDRAQWGRNFWQPSTGQPIRGQLSGKSDQDNYSFSTYAAQQQVSFKFDAPTGNYSNYLLDVYESGDSYTNLYSQRTYKDSDVTVGVLDPGTYYVRVRTLKEGM
jgi:hypothetical protein